LRRAALLAVGLAVLGAPTAAQAYYGFGAQIVSAHFGRLEQADDASQYAAISQNGRYVVVQTRARNLFADDDADPPGRYRVGGLFRFDLETRAIELVADGELHDEATDELLVRGAQNPSLSADGRFVAFSTGHALVPGDTNERVDVYVRDMGVPLRSSGAFELVSAKSGGSQAVTYSPSPPANPGRAPGAEVTRGAAISADGRRVVFRTADVLSDLPDRAAPDTPGGQVLVRDRSTQTTTLITRSMAGGDPAGGALGPAGISADGSTVVWTGRNAAAQTPILPGEQTDNDFFYYLWKRIADGPTAPTRRMTGAVDLDDPGCPPGSTVTPDPTATGPCYGPLTGPERTGADISGQLPAMSADGRTVAFLTGAGPRPNNTTPVGHDLYLTDMRPGVSRKQGTRELTREGTPGDANLSTPIESIAMSSDGRRIALTTSRTAFALPVFSFTGARRQIAGARELYVIDLPAGTIELVTRSFNGGDSNGDVANGVSLTSDGGRLAFVSSASNLLFGDANQRPDAFAVFRQPEPQPQPFVPASAGSAGGEALLEDLGGDEEVRLAVGVRVLARGVVELRVRVPAAGSVTASARARVGRPRRRGPLRTLARATRFSPRAARVTLRLRLVRRYRGQLRRRGRMPARVGVTFFPSRGGARRTRTLRVTFRNKLRRSSQRERRSPQREGRSPQREGRSPHRA
jgi:hypothetical protein